MTPPILLAPRLAVFYGAYFAFIGILGPFWPVWLKAKGLGSVEIGMVLAAGIFAKVIANPVIAHLADRRGQRRGIMVLLAAFAAASFSLFGLTGGFWTILPVSVVFFLAWSSILPLGESLTILSARAHGLDYGRLRLWGSLGFIIAAVGAGRVLVGRPEDVIFWLMLASVAVIFAACFVLPDTRPPASTESHPPIRAVLGNRTFLVFLGAAALIQGSHSVYYGFGTLHWQQVGYSEDLIGWLWAEGVIAEIILFIFGARLVDRFGPAGMILAGGLAGVLRWTLTGLTDALPVLFVVQALHALTFGATHLGAIHFIARAVPPQHSATAQSLYAAVVSGVGMGAGLLLAGRLYDAFSGAAYLYMAGAAAAGAVLALVIIKNPLPGQSSET